MNLIKAIHDFNNGVFALEKAVNDLPNLANAEADLGVAGLPRRRDGPWHPSPGRRRLIKWPAWVLTLLNPQSRSLFGPVSPP